MTCLIWRQHRGQALWTVLTVTALCAVLVNFGLSAEHWLAGYHTWLRQLAAAGCPPPTAHSGAFHVRSAAACLALKGRYPGGLQASFVSRYNAATLLSRYGLPAVFAAIGAMLGAPLVAREVEQHTHLAAWTQSVSRCRWYTAKVSALVAGLAVAGLATGAVNAWLQHHLTAGDTGASRWSWFAASGLALAGEAALAFALAVALGAVLRRTLPAIGAGMAGAIVLLLGTQWLMRALSPGSWIHPPSQYWPLQLALFSALLALAAAALASGWWATRARAV